MNSTTAEHRKGRPCVDEDLQNVAESELTQRWPLLQNSDLQILHGSTESLAQVLSRRSGVSETEALRQIREWLAGRAPDSRDPSEQSRLDGEDAGKGSPGQSEPSVG